MPSHKGNRPALRTMPPPYNAPGVCLDTQTHTSTHTRTPLLGRCCLHPRSLRTSTQGIFIFPGGPLGTWPRSDGGLGGCKWDMVRSSETQKSYLQGSHVPGGCTQRGQLGQTQVPCLSGKTGVLGQSRVHSLSTGDALEVWVLCDLEPGIGPRPTAGKYLWAWP